MSTGSSRYRLRPSIARSPPGHERPGMYRTVCTVWTGVVQYVEKIQRFAPSALLQKEEQKLATGS